MAPSTASKSLAKWHGNAWLRAASIHGKLLTDDGDIALAWRLFAEYRTLHGDDYNFSLAFGDFCAELKQYDLAWKFLQRARFLKPQCPATYLKLEQIAARTSGTREEVRARMERAKLGARRGQQEISRYRRSRSHQAHLRRLA